MKIDPKTQKNIAEALAAGTAKEGPPPVIPMPSADLYKTPTVKLSEAEFQRQVIDLARSRGWRVAHFRHVRVQRASGETYWETPVAADGKGFPDLLMVRGTWAVVAELKVPPNTTRPEQDAWLEAFDKADIAAYVWTPGQWPEIEEVLR